MKFLCRNNLGKSQHYQGNNFYFFLCLTNFGLRQASNFCADLYVQYKPIYSILNYLYGYFLQNYFSKKVVLGPQDKNFLFSFFNLTIWLTILVPVYPKWPRAAPATFLSHEDI